MEKLLIKGAEVYRDGCFTRADVLCVDGVIVAIDALSDECDATVIDAEGLRIAPGMIDVHTHGAAGVDVNAAGVEGLRKIARFFASQGVTAFQASILTDTEETTRQCLRDIQTVMAEQGNGAALLGAHLEGPFLSPQYKGAMPESLLKEGDATLLHRYRQDFPGVVRYLTVSPEVSGVNDMIREVHEDVVVAIGHSGADYETAMQAIHNGARCATHTFNAMRLFHQHEPAIMGAVLESDCWCEAICDGRHLHPGSVRMLLKCKGWDKVVAITDSIMAAGLPDGDYKLGVNDVVVVDGDAKLKEGGSRAGSTLTMAQALRNLLRFTEQPIERVLPLLTQNPAAALRLDAHKGRIAEGLDADLIVLDDAMEIVHTIVGGRLVYSR